MTHEPSLPEPLRAWLQSALGQPVDAVEVGRGAQADVWLLRAGADRCVVKVPRSLAAFEREIYAYETWGTQLLPFVPRLLASTRAPHSALLLEHVEGVAVTTAALRHAPTLFEQAGAFWTRLQTLPHDDEDPLDLPTALQQRFDTWCARAREAVPSALITAAENRFDASAFRDAVRTPCHRDFAPWNWIDTARSSRLVVIDFGQARPDAALLDLVKLSTGVWREIPGAREHFLGGAQRELSELELEQLAMLELLHGLGTVAWAAQHGDTALREHGICVLMEALAP